MLLYKLTSCLSETDTSKTEGKCIFGCDGVKGGMNMHEYNKLHLKVVILILRSRF